MSRTVKTANRAVGPGGHLDGPGGQTGGAPSANISAFLLGRCFYAELINRIPYKGDLSSEAFPYPAAKYRQSCRNRQAMPDSRQLFMGNVRDSTAN